MKRFRYDPTIIKGSTFRRVFQLLQPDGVTPVNLTGYQVRSHMRNRYEDTVFVDMHATILPPEAEGRVQLLLSAEETMVLRYQKAVYDIELVYPNLEVQQIVYGTVLIEPEVTRT